jgi:hypothetical protein
MSCIYHTYLLFPCSLLRRESLPPELMKQLETYLPEDPAVLVGLQKVCCDHL